MSNETKAIAIVAAGSGFKVSIPGEAIRLKNQALERTAAIKQVKDASEQKAAIEAAATAKGLSKEAVKTHAEVKKPYWDAGKAIDAKKTEYIRELDAEVERIERLIGDFQREQERKAQAARMEDERRKREAEESLRREQERAAQAERDRINAEREAEAAKQRRIQAELDAQEASTKAEKRKAEAELARQRADEEKAKAASEKAQQDAQQAEIDAHMAQDDAADAAAETVYVEPPKAYGSAIREKATFEVIDVEAFYAWDVARRKEAAAIGRILPTFVSIEIKKGVFGEYINTVGLAEQDSIPGVIITTSTKASVRSVAPSLTLQ